MPRDMYAWSGKPLAPPPEPIATSMQSVAAQKLSVPVAEPAPAATVSCPVCGGSLRLLASGALGCIGCAAIFQTQTNTAPVTTEPAPSAALDQIDAINAMLRRNTLVLGPGGVPLAESTEDESRASRRRAAQPRRARR